MPRRRKLRSGCIAGMAALAILIGFGWFGFSRYPGAFRGSWNAALHSRSQERENLFYCVSYWLELMEHLRFDPENDTYNFPAPEDIRHLSMSNQGLLAYHRGDFAEAIRLLETAVNSGDSAEKTLFWLALSEMRQAEAVNCLATLQARVGDSDGPRHHSGHHEKEHDHGSMCSLPIETLHGKPEYSNRAAKHLEQLLDEYDSDNRLYRWLLNFSQMTVGGFPEQVPDRYRIDNVFTSTFYGVEAAGTREKYGHLQFADRAAEFGVDRFDTGRGVAIEDFDRDGDFDIVTGGTFSDVCFYRNEYRSDAPQQRFTDATTVSGLDGVLQPFVITSADYDNDGWVDLFVSRPFARSQLMRNEEGVFRDVTTESGLFRNAPENSVTGTFISAWSDIDLDGDLDLFLAQWGMSIPLAKGLLSRPRMDSCLYLNEKGAFVDRTSEFGLGEIVADEYFIGATFGDYDDDGFPDLFLSSPLRNTSRLFHNENGSRFSVSAALHRPEMAGFTASFVDVNHDGRLDLFQAGFGDASSDTAQMVFREGLDEYFAGRSCIFLQTESGSFEPRDDFFSGQFPAGTMGANYGDLNNDGAYDFYLGSGNPEPWHLLPNLMYIGQTEGTRCTGRMENITALHGFGTIQKGHGIVFFDFDQDGDQDIYSALGGMWPADAWPNQFFVNESHLNHRWIKLRLRGHRTNYYGIGARITVHAENAGGQAIVRTYLMDQKTGFGSAPYMAHIGLADAVKVNEVRVYWPVSGKTQSYQVKLGEPGAPPEILEENRQ